MENKKISSNYDQQVDVGARIFMGYDQALLIRKFDLDADADWIYLTYMNTPCRISRADGHIDERVCDAWSRCRSYNTVMTIYDLLCYHKGEMAPSLCGEWCAVGNFVVTGIQETDAFTKKYAEIFDGRLEELKQACMKMGALSEARKAGTDLTCQIPITRFFSVRLQFWEGDDEFPPKLMLLWDKNANRFLHFETMFFLQGDLLARLEKIMGF